MDFNKLLQNRKLLVGAGVGLLILILIVWIFASFNGTQKGMVQRETALSAQYQDNQNELSSYISTIKEQLGVANSNTAALDQVLSDAVKGRYDQGSTAQVGQGQLFSAIQEAYPDLSQVSVNYSKIMESVQAGREAYKNQQTRLLDMLRDYDTWRNSGFIHSKIASMVGAPSQNLTARIGTQVTHGADAEAQMYLIVLTTDTQQAYQSGTMDPLDLGPATQK